MIDLIDQHRGSMIELCRRFGVRRLELFGSGCGDRFDPGHSDLDFLVEFESTDYHGAADRYFGLMEELEHLLERPIDLIEVAAINNPFFLRGIARSRTLLYAA